MAVKITATLTARRSDLRADTISADNTTLVAHQVRRWLMENLPAALRAGNYDIEVTAQNVTKNGTPKDAAVSTTSTTSYGSW